MIKKKDICQKIFQKKFGAIMVCISICPKLSSPWFPFGEEKNKNKCLIFISTEFLTF